MVLFYAGVKFIRTMARPEPRKRSFERLEFVFDATVLSYAAVFFSSSRVLGSTLLAATLTAPTVGLLGLAGVWLCNVAGALLGYDRSAIRGGLLGYNGLLTALVVGAAYEPSATLAGLAVVGAFAVVIVHVALSGSFKYHLNLPVLSVPFVLVTWLVLALVPAMQGLTPAAAVLAPVAFPGPAALERFLVTLGAVFLVPTWTAGALILAGIVVWSRIAAVHAVAGYLTALVMQATLLDTPVHPTVLGFNFVLTAVALGGVFFVPGRASLVLAVFGSAFCGLVSVGAASALDPAGWPLLALPFNLAVLVILYALAQRPLDASPRSVDLPGRTPEETLQHFHTRVRRFRQSLPVRLRLPFRGEWVCTQGNDGEHTHQGLWRHGLDFEVADTNGHRYSGHGELVSDWYCYGLPVCSPAPGTVVEVVDGVPDNAVGQMNTDENWGNVVIVQHAPALFSMVAHLQPGSIRVKVGDVVAAGHAVARCGSSGRSPVPHLHFQLQASPRVGEPTVATVFHGVVVSAGFGEVLHAETVPEKAQLLRNPSRQEALGKAFAFTVGQRLQFHVRAGDRSSGATASVETAVCEIDLYGNKSLNCAERKARLWYESAGDGFVAYDYEGPRDSALYAVYCSLARLPYEGSLLAWDDYLNPRRVSTSPWRWVTDAAAVVMPMPELKMNYAGVRAAGVRAAGVGAAGVGAAGVRPSGRYVVRGASEEDSKVKVSTEAVFDDVLGLDRVRVYVDGRYVEATCSVAW